MAVPTWVVGQVLSASDVNNWLTPSAVIKVNDESVTSSTTLQFDDVLFVTLPANSSWDFRCFLDYEGAIGGDIKWQWIVPAGVTVRYHVFCRSGGGVFSGLLSGATLGQADGGGAGVLEGITMDGTVVMGSTAGNMSLEWAQITSSTTPTIVHAQSRLIAQRVS